MRGICRQFATMMTAGMTIAMSASLPAQTVANQPLAPGEVLLTVSGSGLQTTSPDFASLTVMLISNGPDNATVMAANRKLIANVTKSVTSAGVPPSAIQMLSSDSMNRLGFVAAPPPETTPETMAALSMMQNSAYTATSTMTIRMTDMNKLATLRESLMGITGVQAMPVQYGLNDDSSARRAAIDQALAKARSQAVLYAKSMNMRIERTLRVSDAPTRFFGDEFTETFNQRGRSPREGVQTSARVEIDLVLKPL